MYIYIYIHIYIYIYIYIYIHMYLGNSGRTILRVAKTECTSHDLVLPTYPMKPLVLLAPPAHTRAYIHTRNTCEYEQNAATYVNATSAQTQAHILQVSQERSYLRKCNICINTSPPTSNIRMSEDARSYSNRSRVLAPRDNLAQRRLPTNDETLDEQGRRQG
jgi:hypothetical protein